MHPDEMMGMGTYVGEIRQSPDGSLYQWEEGVDGFGNPIGFWKAIRSVGRAVGRGLKTVRKVARLPGVRQLLPVAAGMIPGIGPAAAAGIKAAQGAGILGLGDIEPELMGLGNYVGEIRQGPDGNLYQWEEGIDGFGSPFGFWKAIRRAVRGVRRGISTARRIAKHPLAAELLRRARSYL